MKPRIANSVSLHNLTKLEWPLRRCYKKIINIIHEFMGNIEGKGTELEPTIDLEL